MRYCFNLILFFLLTIAVHAQESAQVMTLEKAIALGLENNFRIKIDEQAIKIAENNNTWARAGKGPTVDLRGYFNNSLTSNNNPASFLQGTFYNGSLGVAADANWVIYSGGRIAIAKDQLELAVTQQRLNQQTGIQDLMRDVYTSYYAVLLQQERLNVLRESLALSKSRLEYEEVKKDFGSSNSYNVLQFEANILSDSTNMVTQEIQIEIAKRNLYNVLDIVGMSNYVFSESLNTTVEEINEKELKEILAEESFTLKSLALIAELDLLNAQLAEVSRKPTISLNGTIGVAQNGFKFFKDDPSTGDPFKFLESQQFNLGLNANANWNLYDGGVRKTNIENAKLQQELTQMNVLEAKVALENQLDILIANYNNQRTLIQMADEQLQLSQQNLTITEERFKAGRLTSLDFRNVQNQYLNAAFNKVNAIYQLILTKTDIDYLVGRFQ